jgi:hypothetical protein
MSDLPHKVRGHKWTGAHVLVIYDDPTKGQYYIHPVTQCPIYPVSKPHLPEGQDWLDMGKWICTFPHAGQIAIHEAGHTAICLIEGIKVEYVTIEPHQAQGERLGGICQIDHDIVAKRKAIENDQQALSAWAEKEGKFLLGGIVAEKRFLREAGLKEEPLHAEAWSRDEEQLDKRIAHRSLHLGSDAGADRERIVKEVEAVINKDQVWAGVRRIARRLVQSGAISGKMAEELFKA